MVKKCIERIKIHVTHWCVCGNDGGGSKNWFGFVIVCEDLSVWWFFLFFFIEKYTRKRIACVHFQVFFWWWSSHIYTTTEANQNLNQNHSIKKNTLNIISHHITKCQNRGKHFKHSFYSIQTGEFSGIVSEFDNCGFSHIWPMVNIVYMQLIDDHLLSWSYH